MRKDIFLIMGVEKSFFKEKLIIPVLISDLSLKNNLLTKLKFKYGKIDYESSLLEFNLTNYYNKEMGIPIFRFFITFKKLI